MVIDDIIKFIKDSIDLNRNVKDTFNKMGQGNVSGAAQSYSRTILPALAVSKLAPKTALSLGSMFNTTKSGILANSLISKSGTALSKTANWWLTPAKSLAKGSADVVKTTIPKLANKGILPKLGVATAVVGGEHVLAKIGNGISTIDYIQGLFNSKKRQELLSADKPSNVGEHIVNIMTASHPRRTILKFIDKASKRKGAKQTGGNKNE